MSEIKSEKANRYAMRNMFVCPDCKDRSCRLCYLSVRKSYSDGLVESEKRHAKALQELKDKAVDRASVTMGAMILDGYDPEDSCVKYVQELIEELKELNEQ